MVSCQKCKNKYGSRETGFCRDCLPPPAVRKGAQLARRLRTERLPTYQFNDVEKRHYVYICQCKDRTFYTGITHDLKKRTQAHQDGKGARYTKEHGFDKLVYFELCPDKTTAENREREIKDKRVQYKRLLIARFKADIDLLGV